MLGKRCCVGCMRCSLCVKNNHEQRNKCVDVTWRPFFLKLLIVSISPLDVTLHRGEKKADLAVCACTSLKMLMTDTSLLYQTDYTQLIFYPPHVFLKWSSRGQAVSRKMCVEVWLLCTDNKDDWTTSLLCVYPGRNPDVWWGSEDDVLALNPPPVCQVRAVGRSLCTAHAHTASFIPNTVTLKVLN